MAETSEYREYLLKFDDFGNGKIFTDQQAIACLLTRLIVLEPGTNPLFPEMGVGIVSKYRYVTEDHENDLRKDIRNQISRYLPEANCTNIEFTHNDDKTIDIKITIDGTLYTYQSSSMIPIILSDMKM